MERTGEKPTKIEDRKLVEMALARHQGAFTMLLEKYRGPLMAHILKFVKVVEDAEDICQRSFEKAFMNIDRYDPHYAFSTWLYNIAQNESIDHLRRNRTSIASVPISEENEVMEMVGSVSPEEEVIVDQAVSRLIDSIHALPEKYMKVAECRFIKDMAYDDIALELGLPLNTVKTRISRAREMLRQNISIKRND